MATGRIALVTGGGAGMGKAICLRLARDGHAVGVLGIDSANISEVASMIAAQGGRAMPVQADVANRAQIDAAVEKVHSELGPITILVNNAGVENFSPIGEVDEPTWDRLMAVNLKGVYHVTQTVLPDMVAAGWGRIVTMSALGAQVGASNMSLYTATKGGAISMTRSLALELGPKGITVNSIAPGFIDTPMARRAIDGGLFPVPYEQILATYPIPRIGRPEEVAAACAFFVSEEAGYITGQLLGVNGGAAV